MLTDWILSEIGHFFTNISLLNTLICNIIINYFMLFSTPLLSSSHSSSELVEHQLNFLFRSWWCCYYHITLILGALRHHPSISTHNLLLLRRWMLLSIINIARRILIILLHGWFILVTSNIWLLLFYWLIFQIHFITLIWFF